MRRLGTTFIAASLLLLAAAGGCTGARGAPAEPAASPSPTADLMALAHQLVVCARAHGMPEIGEPTMGSDGRPHLPNEEHLQIPQSTRTACQPIVNQLSAAEGDDYQPKPADVPKLIQFSECMRSHGFPHWPDPNSDGTYPADQMPAGKTPALGPAMAACQRYNPDPGGRVPGGGLNAGH